MTEKREPTEKAASRIGPELAKDVKQSQTGLPIVHLKDGKVNCPGCSLEIPVIDPGPGVVWVQMNVACQGCSAKFIVRDQDAGPSQLQEPSGYMPPYGSGDMQSSSLHGELTDLVDKYKKPGGGSA